MISGYAAAQVVSPLIKLFCDIVGEDFHHVERLSRLGDSHCAACPNRAGIDQLRLSTHSAMETAS